MTDKDIIAEAKEFHELCVNTFDKDRQIALDDMKFGLGGANQWDDLAVASRQLEGRPCLTINNIPAIVHQVTNDVRQNRQSIHVHPTDAESSEEVAEVIEGLIRHIEYDSGADAAYDKALECAVKAGFGFFTLVTEYCDPMSFDQDIKIKRVRNPFNIYLDPAAVEADGSDSRRAIMTARMPKMVFEAEYPDREPTAEYFATNVGADKDWLGKDFVRVAVYYRIEEAQETLLRLSDGTGRLKSDKRPLPPGVVLTGESRPTTTRKVMWYKLTALEVLEKKELPFKWIPIFPVYGEENDIDGEVSYTGLIRNAKDPKRLENYWLTAATEEIALRTKTPFIGAAGQFEGFEKDWNEANVKSFPYLEYNPVNLDGVQAPPPQRQPPSDVPSGFIAMAGLARDNVKAVTGIYDASLGNRSNETSGIAIRARQHQGDVGNFHFSDNLSRAIKHCGRTILSAIPIVYDAPRIARVVGADGQASTVEINTPTIETDETGQAITKIKNDMTVGQYDCIVTSGPAYNTLREEAAANMIEMGGKWPKLMDVAGDKIVRALDWPGAEEIADRLEKTLPPGLADKPQDGKEAPPMVQTPNGPIPLDQAGQMIGQMDHALSQMQQELEQHEAGIKKAEIAAAASIEVARINAEARGDNAELSAFAKLLQMQAAPQIDHAAAVQAAADPAHPNAPAPVAQGLEQAPADAQASDQGHQQAMEMQASQPEPDAGNASAPEGAEA